MKPHANEPFDTIARGDLEGLKRLVAADPTVLQRRDRHGFSPLMMATMNHRQDMADAITQAELSLDLFEAAALGQAWRAESLLKRDPLLALARNAQGQTALLLACRFGQAETAQVLLRHGASALAAGNDIERATPLHLACQLGSRPLAQLLLDAGAAVNAPMAGNKTPLHLAAQSGDSALCALLLARGADLSARTDDGRTPYDFAMEAAQMDAAEQLKL